MPSTKSVLVIPQAQGTTFELPSLFFTVKGNKNSEKVLKYMESLMQDSQPRFAAGQIVLLNIFETEEDALNALQNGMRSKSVALFDTAMGSKMFSASTLSRLGEKGTGISWVDRSQWYVRISEGHKASVIERQCGHQVAANFGRNFAYQINNGQYPWGHAKKGEPSPQQIQKPTGLDAMVERLNSGPDLLESVASDKFALELPPNSKISWVRVPLQALEFDGKYMDRVLRAFRSMQRVEHELAQQNLDIQKILLNGVHFLDPALRNLYLRPPTDHFEVSRPDLHWTGQGLFPSEEDEMPGGLPDLFHLDAVYGTNQDGWDYALRWLCQQGQLLFIVSSQWSECYTTATRWLVGELQSRGYDVAMVTTDDLSGVSITGQGVFLGGRQVGTIWRQFPVFETVDKLADIIHAAAQGLVRVVPQFAHYGNKAWFSIFRLYKDLFRQRMESGQFGLPEGDDILPHQTVEGAEAFALLDAMLPDSHLVLKGSDLSFPLFPFTVAGVRVESMAHLKNLTTQERDALVLKVCGANSLAARSYGVLMGHDLKQLIWQEWIEQREQDGLPFIVQQRIGTGLVQVPVYHTKHDITENFLSRVLIRPWVMGERLISATGTIVPSDTERVHGMVAMAVCPVKFV